MIYFTEQEILKGREAGYPLTPRMKLNLAALITALSDVREAWGKPLVVTSGYRPGSFNKNAGGAKNSAHLTCEAADLADPDRSFAKWCLDNLDVLERAGLWMEDPKYTKGWVHLQTRPVSVRVFKP